MCDVVGNCNFQYQNATREGPIVVEEFIVVWMDLSKAEINISKEDHSIDESVKDNNRVMVFYTI